MRARSAALLAAAAAAWVTAAKADVVVNTFDNSDSAAEVAQWRLDFGSFQSAVLGFSSDDADGSGTSGSMDVLLNYNTATGAQFVDYTRDFFPGFDGSQFLTLDMDVKVVPGSATDQFGQSGFFQLSTRNGDNYDSAGDFADNVRISDGWRHISVPLNPPDDSIRGLTFQLYSAEATNAFPGPSGQIDLHIDNVKFTTSAPPGVLRGGHHFSFESANGEIDSTHANTSTPRSFAFGDSYNSSATNNVDHTQSTLYPTDGAHTVRFSQAVATNVAAGTYGVDSQVTYDQSDPGRFNALIHSTKLLLDVTTPGHGPGYQTLEADLNFGSTYLSSFGTSGYQFVDGNAGGADTRTTASTQTYTWDFGGYMQEAFGTYFPGVTGYTIIHFATGNGGAAVGDPSPDATSEYFLDNMRVINEDVTTRATWQTTATADWNSANWGTVALATDKHVTPVSAPNGQGVPAIFYGYGAATGTGSFNSTVTVSSAITVGSIIFDSQMTSFDFESSGVSAASLPQIVNYTLSGSGSLTLDSGANASEIYAVAGNHTIGVPVTVKSDLEIDTSAGFTADTGGAGRPATVAMTSLAFTSPITLNDKVTLTTHGAGTVGFASISPASGAKTGLVINGGHANLNGNVNVGSLAVAAAGNVKVTAGGSTVVRTGSLQMLGGTLDLTNNKMIVDYTGTSQITDIQSALASGFNGGAWNGAGIVSSNAAASTSVKTAIGYGDAATLHISSFGGQGVTSAVLLEYTLAGDANLDGKVNLLDLNAVATNYGGSSKVWTDGDTTYDGHVNVQDFNALALNYGQTAPISAAPLGALVPEPGSMALMTVIGIAAAQTRRRKAR